MNADELIVRIARIQEDLERLKKDIENSKKAPEKPPAPIAIIKEVKDFSVAESFIMFLAANGKL